LIDGGVQGQRRPRRFSRGAVAHRIRIGKLAALGNALPPRRAVVLPVLLPVVVHGAPYPLVGPAQQLLAASFRGAVAPEQHRRQGGRVGVGAANGAQTGATVAAEAGGGAQQIAAALALGIIVGVDADGVRFGGSVCGRLLADSRSSLHALFLLLLFHSSITFRQGRDGGKQSVLLNALLFLPLHLFRQLFFVFLASRGGFWFRLSSVCPCSRV